MCKTEIDLVNSSLACSTFQLESRYRFGSVGFTSNQHSTGYIAPNETFENLN